MDGSKRTGYSRTQDSKNQENVRAPPVKWEGVVKWVPPCFPGIPGRSPGWGPAFTDACLSSLVFPIHTSCFMAILHLSLDSVSPGAILSIYVFSATRASSLHLWLRSLSAFWGVCLSLHVPVLAFCSLSLSLCLTRVISSFIFGPWLPSWSYISSPHPCLPVISDAGFYTSIHLCAGSCHSVSLPIHLGPSPAHLSSSVPSSPLSPSPSAVSPTGSACCSRCSCTAVWGPWPGAT